MSTAKQKYRLRAIAEKAGVSTETVRLYLKRGELGEAEMLGNGIYHIAPAKVNAFIKKMKERIKLGGQIVTLDRIYKYEYTQEEAEELTKDKVATMLQKAKESGKTKRELDKMQQQKTREYLARYLVKTTAISLRKPANKLEARKVSEIPPDLLSLVAEKYTWDEAKYFINCYQAYEDKGLDLDDPTVELLVIDVIDDSLRINRLRDLLRIARDGLSDKMESILTSVTRRRLETLGALGEVRSKGQLSDVASSVGKASREKRGGDSPKDSMDEIK